MTSTQRDIASFVLRFTQDLWQDSQGEPHVEWRGHIRHIQGDEETRFTDFAEAVAFIQRYLAQLTLGALKALPGGEHMDQEKTLHESFKLWEKFTSTYTNMMFGAMEKAVEQSETFRKHMDDAVTASLGAWKAPPQASPEQVVEALQALQAQVQALADKVDSLEKTLQEDDGG